jgi:hypothetical protein
VCSAVVCFACDRRARYRTIELDSEGRETELTKTLTFEHYSGMLERANLCFKLMAAFAASATLPPRRTAAAPAETPAAVRVSDACDACDDVMT